MIVKVKKLNAFALCPVNYGNHCKIFSDKTYKIKPQEAIALSTGIALDVGCYIRVLLLDLRGTIIPYSSRGEVKIEFQNETDSLLTINRGDQIGTFTVYEIVDPTLVEVLEFSENVPSGILEFKKDKTATKPLKIGTRFAIFLLSNQELQSNRECRLRTGIRVKFSSDLVLNAQPKIGGFPFYASENELTVFYTNPTSKTQKVESGNQILSLQLYRYNNPCGPKLLQVERFKGDPTIKIVQDPCGTRDLFQ